MSTGQPKKPSVDGGSTPPASTGSSPKSHVDLKVIILGNGRVGKTSIIYRYINDDFTDTTIGASFVLKKWLSFYLGIWDTAGQEKFSRISSYYCRGAQAAILAYDITDAASFTTLPTYAAFLRDADRDCYVVVVGTKLDLVQEDPSRRQVSEEEAREFARSFKAPWFETSAKSNINVATVFDTIGYHCLANRITERTKSAAESQTPPSSSSSVTPQRVGNGDQARTRCCSIF